VGCRVGARARACSWRRRFVALVTSFALVAVLYSAQSKVNPQRPQLAAVGQSHAAWGTLPRTDLSPIVFSPAMSETHFRDWMRMSRYTFDELADRLARKPTYRTLFHEDGLPYLGAPGPRRKTTLHKEVAHVHLLAQRERVLPSPVDAVRRGRGEHAIDPPDPSSLCQGGQQHLQRVHPLARLGGGGRAGRRQHRDHPRPPALHRDHQLHTHGDTLV